MAYIAILNNSEQIDLPIQNSHTVEQIKDYIIKIYQFPKEASFYIQIDGQLRDTSYVLATQPKSPIIVNLQFETTISFSNKLYSTQQHLVDICKPINKLQKELSILILPIQYSVQILQPGNNTPYLNSYKEIPKSLEFIIQANIKIIFKDIPNNFKINPFETIRIIKNMISKFLKIQYEIFLLYNNTQLNDSIQYITYQIPDHSIIDIVLETRIQLLVKFDGVVHQYSNLSNQKLGVVKNRIRQNYQIPQDQQFQLFYQNIPLENDEESISNLFNENDCLVNLKYTGKIYQLTLQDQNSSQKICFQVQSFDLVSSLEKKNPFINKQVTFYQNKQELIKTKNFEQLQVNSNSLTIYYQIEDKEDTVKDQNSSQEIIQFNPNGFYSTDKTNYQESFSPYDKIANAKLKDKKPVLCQIIRTKFQKRNGHQLYQKDYNKSMTVKEIQIDFLREISKEACKFTLNQTPVDENKRLSEITDQAEIAFIVDIQHNLKLLNKQLQAQQFSIQFYPTENVASIFSKHLIGDFQYYINSQLIDIQKTFEDNQIQNNSLIYYLQIVLNITLKDLRDESQIIQIQVSPNNKIIDVISRKINMKQNEKIFAIYNNHSINLENTFEQERIQQGTIEIKSLKLKVHLYDDDCKMKTFEVLPSQNIGDLIAQYNNSNNNNNINNKNQKKKIYKQGDQNILTDKIEFSTLINSQGEVVLEYKESIDHNIILHQPSDTIPNCLVLTQNVKTIEVSTQINLKILWNDEEIFVPIRLNQKIKDFRQEFEQNNVPSKVMFFLEGAVIDECKTFEELEVKESSYCQFIDQ